MDLNTLTKPQKIIAAEKHLLKYLEELKRHFGFSDFQLIKLLEKSSSKIKQTKKEKIKSSFFAIFLKK